MGSSRHDKVKGSAARLWQLIEQRTQSGADIERIDRRIWDLFGEDWAIVFTDLSGFSRRVAEYGIIHFLQTIYEHHELLLPIVADHDGLLVKTEADSLLLLFKRVEGALDCSIAMQRACQNLSMRRKPEEQVLLCLGIGAGRVLRIGDEDVYGKEVNAASKLGEDTAGPNEILLTGAARAALDDANALDDRADLSFEPLDVEVAGSDHNVRLLYQGPLV